MAVSVAVSYSSETDINFEVGEYQPMPKPDSAAAKMTKKQKFRHVDVVLLSFGLLCILQAILNISLRLAATESTVQVTGEGSCPKNWLMFGSSCYFISSQRRSWNDSRQDCVHRDADLVIIDSRREQAFLTGFTVAAWVGMTDREMEGSFFWVDGTPVDKKRLQWARGQPDEAFRGEDCVELRTMIQFMGLNDLNCSTLIQWICEKML